MKMTSELWLWMLVAFIAYFWMLIALLYFLL